MSGVFFVEDSVVVTGAGLSSGEGVEDTSGEGLEGGVDSTKVGVAGFVCAIILTGGGLLELELILIPGGRFGLAGLTAPGPGGLVTGAGGLGGPLLGLTPPLILTPAGIFGLADCCGLILAG